MERAGAATACNISDSFSEKKALICCGTGNNGGDGLVIARELANAGYKVTAIVAGNRNRLSPDCKLQYSISTKLGIAVGFGTRLTKTDLHGAVVVDALFGTGLNKNIKGPAATLIRRINSSGRPVVSVDIPSGISADTGNVLGSAVKADLTVTFGLPKRGHFLYPGSLHTGRLVIENIGFPPKLFEKVSCTLPEAGDISRLLPERPSDAHKGSFGHVLIIAGSSGKTGASFMAAEACLRSGAGLISIGAPESLSLAYQSRVTEEMFLALPDTGEGTLSEDAIVPVLSFLEERATVLAIGPGIGTDHSTARLVRNIIKKCPVPMVVDADALNALENNAGILSRAKSPIVLTPHPGEFRRISGMKKADIMDDRIGAGAAFARQSSSVVMLKGAPTVIACPDGRSFINPTGNPGLAKAGSGDVLTGMAAGFLAQGAGVEESAVLSAYIHGLAADIAACRGSERSLIASDVISAIPEAFSSVKEAGNGTP
jgi:NAD(P)H-hydrate epimerase